MPGNSFVRLMLAVSAIVLWCCGVVASASAQDAMCTGNQTVTDASGNQCMSLVVTGPQGPSSAMATANGPSTMTSIATSQATNNSSATSTADISCGVGAFAFNSSTVNVECADGGGVNATAMDSGTADADVTVGGSGSAVATNFAFADVIATLGGNVNAFATNSAIAIAKATTHGSASVFADGPGTAIATASDNGQASANVGNSSFQSSGTAYAFASGGSGAQATVTTPDGFACASASDGSFAQASDTSAPTCDGPDAVVVSTAGNCGAADNSPCAFELHNYFSNANTSGGQASVNITAPIEGIEGAPTPALQKGETCAMIYVFDTAQNMQACCGCPITADGLLTLSISGNLATSPVGSTSLLMDGSIRIMPTFPNAPPPPPGDSLFPGENCDASTGVCCDPAGRSAGNVIVPGSKLVAWGQHIQSAQITESEFQSSATTSVELNDGLPEACADILQLGTGQGQCSCPSGS